MIYLRELLPPYDEPWAELLMADTKDGMTYALSLMGLRFSGNPRKQQIANSMSNYVKQHPEQIIHRLDIAALQHLKQLLEAGKGNHIAVKDIKAPCMLQQMLLVMACQNGGNGTSFCMLDELHDLFAPHLPLIESLIPPEHIRRAVSEIMKQGNVFAEEEETKAGNEAEDGDPSGYCCAFDLMEDIRRLPFEAQAETCKAFHQFIRKTDWIDDYMIERFGQTYRHIKFNHLSDSVHWVRYCINDLDNAITHLDYDDPITFFMFSARLEPLIKKWQKK